MESLKYLDKNGIERLEEWKDVLGYEGNYRISNLSRLTSLNYMNTGKEHLLKTGVNKDYKRATLCKDGIVTTIGLHVLVGINFLGHVPCGHDLVIDHIDRDKMNCRADNLRIVTSRVNCDTSHLELSSKHVGVSWDKKSKKWRAYIGIKNKRIHLGFFNNEEEASKVYEEAVLNVESKLEVKVIKHKFSSNYKGVSWHKRTSKWQSFIVVNKITKSLGFFEDEKEAHEAYLKAYQLHFNT